MRASEYGDITGVVCRDSEWSQLAFRFDLQEIWMLMRG
jgi:hypothetical protein